MKGDECDSTGIISTQQCAQSHHRSVRQSGEREGERDAGERQLQGAGAKDGETEHRSPAERNAAVRPSKHLEPLTPTCSSFIHILNLSFSPSPLSLSLCLF